MNLYGSVNVVTNCGLGVRGSMEDRGSCVFLRHKVRIGLGLKFLEHEVGHTISVVPKLRMSGAIRPLPHKSFWCSGYVLVCLNAVKLTPYSKKIIPFWEDNLNTFCQDILRLLWYSKVQYVFTRSQSCISTSIIVCFFQVVSFIHIFRPEPYIHFSFVPYLPQALLISSSISSIFGEECKLGISSTCSFSRSCHFHPWSTYSPLQGPVPKHHQSVFFSYRDSQGFISIHVHTVVYM